MINASILKPCAAHKVNHNAPGLLCACLLSLLVAFNVSAKSPAPIVNNYGAIVMHADGSRVNYTREDISLQRSRPKANTPTLHADTGQATTSNEFTSSTANFTADWKYFAFGTGIGDSNISVSTVDGITEIITGGGGSSFGGNKYWFILQYNTSTNEYDQVFVGPLAADNDGIKRIVVGDFIPGNSPEIIVASNEGRIELWNQKQRALITSFNAATTDLQAMYAADIDVDGTVEIIVADSSELYIYTLQGILEWQLPGVGGSDVIAAQMDTDPALEIATTDGNIVDGSTRSIEWTWVDGFGFDLEAGDVDNDGMDELIAADAWDFVWAFNVDKQLPKWSLSSWNTGAITLGDIDDDGALELMIGEAQWGDVLAYDAATLALEWQINNPEHGTTGVAYGDTDSDGISEVIWGAGHTSSGPDYLYVANWGTQTIEWSSIHLDGPFRGTVKGDIDGDGLPELVSVSNESESGYGAGRILVFDGTSRNLRAISQEVSGGLGWSGTHEVRLRNVDADPENELVISTSTTYDGAIEIYDFDGDKTFTKIWEIASPLPDGAFRSTEIADIDIDGNLEVVGAASGFIYVYDYTSGLLEWNSLFISSNATTVAVNNTDDDISPEIIALGNDGDIYIFDGISRELEAILFADASALRTQVTAAGPDILIQGSNNGDLTYSRFSGGSYDTIANIPLGVTAIDGLTLGPRGLLAIGSAGSLSLYSQYGGTLLWQSENFGSVFGTHSSFFFNEGFIRIISAGSYGLVGFKAQ